MHIHMYIYIRVYVGLGLYRDNGKENGNYYLGVRDARLGVWWFRVQGLGLGLRI